MYHIFFIHSSADVYVFAIVNSAAMNIGVHVSFQIRVFSGYMPRSGIAWSYVNSTLPYPYPCPSVTCIFWSPSGKERTMWDQWYYFIICLRKGRLREVNNLPVVTQLVRGRAKEYKRVAAEYRFRKIGRRLEFIETESVGCLPALGGPMAADGLQSWGQGWRRRGRDTSVLSGPGSKVSTARSTCPPGRGSGVYIRAHFWRVRRAKL